MIGVLITILLMIGISMLAGASELLTEAFSGDWMRFDEEPTERERLELENSEFDYGHNVNHNLE